MFENLNLSMADREMLPHVVYPTSRSFLIGCEAMTTITATTSSCGTITSSCGAINSCSDVVSTVTSAPGSEMTSILSSSRPSFVDDGMYRTRVELQKVEFDSVDEFKEIQLHGATCDIKSAYQQFSYSRDAAYLFIYLVDG